jgi:hypothetical protein
MTPGDTSRDQICSHPEGPIKLWQDIQKFIKPSVGFGNHFANQNTKFFLLVVASI